MVIFKENKKKTLSENTSNVSLQDFYNLVGKKRTCLASWTSKSGFIEVEADHPAYCGFGNGYFYITVSNGALSVSFSIKSISSITKAIYDDGTPNDYSIFIRDGSRIALNLS